MKKFEALIFDMDGVLVDNLKYHLRAWLTFCERYGIYMSEEEFIFKMFGGTNKDLMPRIFQREITGQELIKLAEEKEQIYRDLHSPFIKPLAGLNSFINAARAAGYKTAVATAGPKENLEFVLSKTGLTDLFDVTLNDSLVVKGKPDPEIYLTAAKLLHVPPAKCLAFEDSHTGIASATGAGMSVVGVATSNSRESLKHTWKVIADFTEINIHNLI